MLLQRRRIFCSSTVSGASPLNSHDNNSLLLPISTPRTTSHLLTSCRRCCSTTAAAEQQQQSSPPQPSTTTATTTSKRFITCILCDEDIANTDWHAHAQTPEHVARFAVCQELCAPERNAAMMAQLWDHIRLDFDGVDAATAQRVARRRRRLASTARYLRDCHVLQDCLLFETRRISQLSSSSSSPSGGGGGGGGEEEAEEEITSDDDIATALNKRLDVATSFSKLVHVGERAMRAELVDRCMRLFPAASAVEVESIVKYILSPNAVATVFDLLNLKHVIFVSETDVHGKKKSTTTAAAADPNQQEAQESKKSPVGISRNLLVALSDATKRQVVIAMMGELSLYNTRQRPASVGSKKDADTIVTHVLSTHVVENLMSELLHHSLQKVVDEGTPMWREFKDSLPELALMSYRPSLPLAQEKKQKKKEATTTGSSDDGGDNDNDDSVVLLSVDVALREILAEVAELKKLRGTSVVVEKFDADGDADQSMEEEEQLAAVAAMQPNPRLAWSTIVREGTLELSVPKPANRGAFFAQTLPKVSVSIGSAAAGAMQQQQQQQVQPMTARKQQTSSSSSSATAQQQQKASSTIQQQQQQQAKKMAQAAASAQQQQQQRAQTHQLKPATAAATGVPRRVAPATPVTPGGNQQRMAGGAAAAGGAAPPQHHRLNKPARPATMKIMTVQKAGAGGSEGGATGAATAPTRKMRLKPIQQPATPKK